MPRHTPGNYVPLDVNYPSDAGIRAAGEAAELLFVRGLAYCKRTKTDGYVPDYDLPVVAVGLRNVPKRVTALVQHGLWVRDGDGHRVRSWPKWNRGVTSEEAFTQGQSKAGGKGNHERWHAGRGVTDAACGWCHPDREPDREPDSGRDREPDRTPESPIREGKGREEEQPPTPSADASEFEEFWAAYPRKTAKPAARKAWRAATKRAAPSVILDGLRRTQFRDDPQFVPHPATWLNQDRWSDEPTQLRVVPGSGRLTEDQVVAILGPDRWNPPTPPPGLSSDERWEWDRQQRIAHIADRQAAARSATSGVTA